MSSFIEKLVPKKGFLWKVAPGFIQNFFRALSEEPLRIKAFLKKIVTESNPETAIDTQQEWFQQYGIDFENPPRTIEEQQSQTKERFVALGGQDIVYLQEQADIAGLPIFFRENKPPPDPNGNECGPAECGVAECWGDWRIDEDWIFFFYVVGNPHVEKKDYDRLDNLIERLTPAHLTPILFVHDPTNVCGPAICGSSICDG